jgi:hypothetical protein
MKSYESLRKIEAEYKRATTLYPQFHSNHEGYAVLKEEVDELWDEIKKSKDVVLNDLMKAELIQIGAMCVRFLNDLSLK